MFATMTSLWALGLLELSLDSNDLYVIHPKSVPDADVAQVPAGWTRIFHDTLAGTGYTARSLLAVLELV
jgi:hypothetical protein